MALYSTADRCSALLTEGWASGRAEKEDERDNMKSSRMKSLDSPVCLEDQANCVLPNLCRVRAWTLAPEAQQHWGSGPVLPQLGPASVFPLLRVL